MSGNIKRFFVGILLFSLVLASVACSGNPADSSNSSESSHVGTPSSDTASSDTDNTVEPGQQTGSQGSTTGTGSGTKSQNPSPSGTTTGGADKPAGLSSLKGTTLNILNWNDAGDVPGVPQMIKKFQDQNKITIKWKMASFEEYTSTLASLVAAGDGPDIVRVRNLNPAQLTHLQPLSVSGNNFSSDIWDKKVLSYYTVNGKTYCANLKNTLLQQPTVMHYNRSLITKYDLEDPYDLWKQGKWTWSKFLEICNDFKDAAGSGYYAWAPYFPQIYTEMCGLPMAEVKNGRFVSNFGNPKLTENIQVMAELVEKKIVPVFYADNPGFNTGKYLFATESIINARRTHFHYTALKEKGTLGIVPLPTIPGSAYYQPYFEIEAYGIAKGAKNPKAVPYFLEYYLDANNYDQKTFFNDARGMDVYKWCISQANTVSWTDDVQMPYMQGSNAKAISNLYANELKPASPAQVATVLGKMKTLYEGNIKEYNNTLATMK